MEVEIKFEGREATEPIGSHRTITITAMIEGFTFKHQYEAATMASKAARDAGYVVLHIAGIKKAA